MNNKNAEIAKTFDDHEERYSETVNDALSFSGLDVDFFTRVKADYILDLSKAHFGSSKVLDLLDIGCGVGNFHPLLIPYFNSVNGVDISNSSIDRAILDNPDATYQMYDGLTLPYEDNTFDLATAICVMHHVPAETWPNFALELHRIVKPGGLALIFEHNPRNPVAVHVVNNCPFDEDAILLKPQTTQELLRQAGFQDIIARAIITIPPFNGVFRGIDRLFSRLLLGAQYYVAATK